MNKEYFEALSLYEKFECKDIFGKKYRAVKEYGDTVFVYAPKMHRRGWRFRTEEFFKKYSVIEAKPKDKNATWHRRIDRAIKCLEKSGLWTEKLPYLENLSKMTWEDKEAMNKLYWEMAYPRNFNTPEWSIWFAKYPFLKSVDNDGNPFLETVFLWEMSDVRLKSMHFGKGCNDYYKAEIQEALDHKKKYTAYRVPASYDITFEYRPDINRAWYSEEYRGCGNGYYYIALDNNTAWFLEKD